MGMTSRFHAPKRLDPGETPGNFSCGVDMIDQWAAERAPMAAKHGTAVTYVSRTDDGKTAGFYTLSAYSVNRDDVAGGWLRRNTPSRIPAILIGMLGVAEDCQGEGLGWMLLQDAIARAHHIGEQLGSRALIVDPYDDHARSFYGHFGFRPIPGSDSMFLRLV